MVKQKQVFEVLIDWYTPESGGRQHIPQNGVYYCTTEILHKHKINTWSIALKMNAMSPNEAEMWFLFDHDERHIHIGQLFNLLEGPRCVGEIMIQRLKDSD
ncbi:hypothetical protein [Acinetobacter sp. Tol 5]|uniref:hypothetical protein n=1 Tax=Acinetobacter sp. (strain Tol 5) TaxID=710648 RepID=UPI001C7500D3|nr:hypothetical protein [Acinetobacter sp. Tol 5]BCX74321.1 hypothetical protein TOL5_25210 [Acinetobacter sp. Tol 5]